MSFDPGQEITKRHKQYTGNSMVYCLMAVGGKVIKNKKSYAMTHVKFNNGPFERSINNFVDDLIGGLPVLFNDGYNSLSKQGFVPVNIKETATGYSLDIIAPGFDKADFKVNLDDKILTISAEKKNEMKNETEKQIRKEYSYRSFKRSFTIDEKTDATGIEASYVNGVLTLNLPKKTEVRETAKEIIIK